jgi:hypothetical protein
LISLPPFPKLILPPSFIPPFARLHFVLEPV